MADDFEVVVSAGTSTAAGTGGGTGGIDRAEGWRVPHVWTEPGALVQSPSNGAGVLHVAVALCVLNDVFREGEAMGVPVSGVRVGARGAFDAESWVSLGVTYDVAVDSTASADDVARLVARVDEVAEIPRVLRAGLSVERTG